MRERQQTKGKEGTNQTRARSHFRDYAVVMGAAKKIAEGWEWHSYFT